MQIMVIIENTISQFPIKNFKNFFHTIVTPPRTPRFFLEKRGFEEGLQATRRPPGGPLTGKILPAK